MAVLGLSVLSTTFCAATRLRLRRPITSLHSRLS